MEEFPFHDAEWDAVSEAMGAIYNATLIDDDVLAACAFIELQEVLAGLREKYGDHPVLFETEADVTDDNDERVALYEQARSLALANDLPTISIRVSLAGLLLEDLHQVEAAHAELLACRDELNSAQDFEQQEWHKLLAQCDSLAGRAI